MASECFLQGIPLDEAVNSDTPSEVVILLNLTSYLSGSSNYASIYEPTLVESPTCLKNCKSIQVCSIQADSAPDLVILPLVFDESVYGTDCTKVLNEKAKELEESGVLHRIFQEILFLNCLDKRFV